MKGDPERPEARASPGRLSPSSRDRPALHPGPKGGAEGAPDVPDKRGVLEGGARPHFHFSCQPSMPAGTTKDERRPEQPEARASPGRLSPSSRDRRASHPGPTGGAGG